MQTNVLSSSPVSTLSSSYEEYMIKSHILSKMYLQQYCSNLTASHSEEEATKNDVKKNGDQAKRKDTIFDSPLDLSTRQLDSTPQTIKDRIYPPSFPFPSLQHMLLQSNIKIDPQNKSSHTIVDKSENLSKPLAQNTSPKTKSPSVSQSKLKSPAENKDSSGNDLSYACPICNQMFSLHDRYVNFAVSTIIIIIFSSVVLFWASLYNNLCISDLQNIWPVDTSLNQ